MTNNFAPVEAVDQFDDALFAVVSEDLDGQFCLNISVNDGVGVNVTLEMWRDFRDSIDRIFWLQSRGN
jgi:hypothetical protein